MLSLPGDPAPGDYTEILRAVGNQAKAWHGYEATVTGMATFASVETADGVYLVCYSDDAPWVIEGMVRHALKNDVHQAMWATVGREDED